MNGWAEEKAQIDEATYTGKPSTKWIDSYIKADGTIVEGHLRTEANETIADNLNTDVDNDGIAGYYDADADGDGVYEEIDLDANGAIDKIDFNNDGIIDIHLI